MNNQRRLTLVPSVRHSYNTLALYQIIDESKVFARSQIQVVLKTNKPKQ